MRGVLRSVMAVGIAGVVGVAAVLGAPTATAPATRPAAVSATGASGTMVGGVHVSAQISTVASEAITKLPPAPLMPRTVADLKAIQARVEAVVKEALPATVAIILENAQGSGVIVSPDGYVLTAGHVSGSPTRGSWWC